MNALPPPGVLRHLRKLVKLEVIRYPEDVQRPRTRGECAPSGPGAPGGGERPCPWVSCRYHLAITVTHKGQVKVDKRWEKGTMPETCALDVAERGEHTLESVGAIVGFTRERVRQVQEIALRKANAAVEADALESAGEPEAPLPGRARRLVWR